MDVVLPGSRGTGKPCQLRRVTHQEATCEHSIHAQCPACATLSFGLTTSTPAAALCHGRWRSRNRHSDWMQSREMPDCICSHKPSELSQQLMNSLSSRTRTGSQTRAACPWKSGFPLSCQFSESQNFSWEKNSYRPILYTKIFQWAKNSTSNISMFSKGFAPEFVSPETASIFWNSLQNAMESAGIYSNFPKALFRPNKEFIFKESFCKRIQVTQSVENISLLITTKLA